MLITLNSMLLPAPRYSCCSVQDAAAQGDHVVVKLLRATTVQPPHSAAVQLSHPALRWLSRLGARLEVSAAPLTQQLGLCMQPALVFQPATGPVAVVVPARDSQTAKLPLWQLPSGEISVSAVLDPRCSYQLRHAAQVLLHSVTLFNTICEALPHQTATCSVYNSKS